MTLPVTDPPPPAPAPPGPALPPTAGYKSTEAWLTAFKALVSSAIAFCTLFGVAIPTWLRPDAPWVGIAALVVGGAVVSVYTRNRTALKQTIVGQLVGGAWQVTNLGGGPGAPSPAPGTPADQPTDPSLVAADDPPPDAPEPPGGWSSRAQPPDSAPASLGLAEPPPYLSTPAGRSAITKARTRARKAAR